jgi:DNA-binding response OmpR family regulator
MRVLLVEDDDALAEAVILGLSQEHLAVDRAKTLAEAVNHLIGTAYDVVCLDLGLPDGDGLELCSQLNDGQLQQPCRLLMLAGLDVRRRRSPTTTALPATGRTR